MRTVRSFLLLCIAACIITTVSCVAASGTGASRSLRGTDPCTETKRAFLHTGLNNSIPNNAISVGSLHICPGEYSCCTSEMEENLITQSNLDFETTMERKCSPVKNLFHEQYEKFDNFFQKLIDDAKTSLHNLFFHTYGEHYQKHSAVFMELFDNLKGYYQGRALDVSEIFDNFFTTLMQQVFMLQHPKYNIDEEYLTCIAENMPSIRPFKDMPEKITTLVRRAFVTARAFVRGLEGGKDVSYKVTRPVPSAACKKALTKMSYCSKCQGLVSVKPCHGLCMNVMNGCLMDYGGLNSVWNEYIDAMGMLLLKVNGPFNIEAVLEPIDIKLSEAIMTLQEKQDVLKKKIFKLCGTPPVKPATPTDTPKKPNLPIDFSDFQASSFRNVSGGVNPPSMEELRKMMQSLPGLDGQSLPSNTDQEGIEFDLSGSSSSSSSFGSARSRSARSLNSEEEEEEEKKKHKRQRHRRRKGGKRRRGKKHRHPQRHHVTRPKPDMSSMEYQYVGSMNNDLTKHAVSQLTGLSALVVEMRKILTKSQNHWTNLPSAVCSDLSEKEESATCWTGDAEGKYQSPVAEGSENPEMDLDGSHVPDHTVSTQSAVLRITISDLKTAYRGMDPSDVDAEDNEASGDYSGSGDDVDAGSRRINEPPQGGNTPTTDKTCAKCSGAISAPFNAAILLCTALITWLLQ